MNFRFPIQLKNLLTCLLIGLCPTIFTGQATAGLFDSSETGPSRLYVAESLHDGVVSIAQQLEKNMTASLVGNKLMIADFVALNNLNETSSFGQLAAANLLHEMQIRNWSIMDPLFTRDLYIGPTGEFALSRDPKRLPANLPALEIIAGTYQTTADSIILNVRMISANTSKVISTAQVTFPRSQLINSLAAQAPVMPIISLAR